jgi:acetyl-CoA carboxylase biotin carboxyl carrier protein
VNDDGSDLLHALTEEAHTLVQRLRGPVRRVSLRAGDHEVEIEWDPTAGPAAPAAAMDAVAAAPAPAPPVDGRHAITSPLVGTFYRAPEPGARPFVEVGDTVQAGQPVAIVEAMKIMNRIVADRPGRVAEIAAEDGDMVEFAQPLIYLDSGGG